MAHVNKAVLSSWRNYSMVRSGSRSLSLEQLTEWLNGQIRVSEPQSWAADGMTQWSDQGLGASEEERYMTPAQKPRLIVAQE